MLEGNSRGSNEQVTEVSRASKKCSRVPALDKENGALSVLAGKEKGKGQGQGRNGSKGTRRGSSEKATKNKNKVITMMGENSPLTMVLGN